MHNWRCRHIYGHLTGVIAIAAAVSWTCLTRADHLPGDPVEELRQALRTPIIDPTNADELSYRSELLNKRVDALRSLGDLRRALLLQGWNDEDQEQSGSRVDRAARDKVARRFEKGIRAVLRRGNTDSRLAAITMLGDMGTMVRGAGGDRRGLASRLAPELAELTRAQEPQIREEAARALGNINPRPQDAVSALQKLLHSADVADRRAAAAGLDNLMQKTVQNTSGKSKTLSGVDISRADVIQVRVAAVPVAASGLTDSDAEVRRPCMTVLQNAALLLGELVLIPPSGTVRFPPSGRKLSAQETEMIGEYQRDVEVERKELSPLAAAFKNQTQPLVAALNDADAEVRLLTCHTFEDLAMARNRFHQRTTYVPSQSANQPKQEGSNNPDSQLLECLRAALPGLAERLGDPVLSNRLAALDALEILRQDAAPVATALAGALEDRNHFVRWAAARVVGKVGPVETDISVPRLARLMSDRDNDVRLTAANTLKEFGPAARAAVPALAEAVSRGDAEIRIGAMQALAGIGTDAQSALPTIQMALTHQDSRVRRAAAEVLDHFGPLARNAAPALQAALNDSDPDVRRAASDALLSVLPIESTQEEDTPRTEEE